MGRHAVVLHENRKSILGEHLGFGERSRNTTAGEMLDLGPRDKMVKAYLRPIHKGQACVVEV